jgi:hypothetical protein
MNSLLHLKQLVHRFHRDERGASYNLGVLIQIPFLIVIIATAVEVNALMLTKLGVQHASAAVARAATVWLPAEPTNGQPADYRLEMIRLAAVQNLTPFASGRQEHQRGLPSDSLGVSFADAQAVAIQQLSERKIDPQYIVRKHLYARAAVKIEIEVGAEADPVTGSKELVSADGLVQVRFVGAKRAENQLTAPELKVRLTFQKPIDLPVVGRFLGRAAPWSGSPFFTREVSHDATATLEHVRSRSKSLGITYQTY